MQTATLTPETAAAVLPPTWSGNQPIPTSTTAASPFAPGMACFNDVIYAAFLGATNNNLYMVTFDGTTWAGNSPIESDGGTLSSTAAPSLAVFNGLLYMAYKSSGNDNLYLAWFNGTSWQNSSIENMSGGISPESNYGPAIMAFDGKLCMAYKGAHSNDLYFATYDGSSWDGNQKISDMSGGISPESNYGPSLAVYNGVLNMVYQGAHSDDIYQSTWNGSSWAGDDQITVSRDLKGEPETNYTPCICTFDDKLYMLYKGAHSNDIYQVAMHGQSWKGNVKISAISKIDPTSDQEPGAAVLPAASGRGAGTMVMISKDEDGTTLNQSELA